MPIYYLDLQSAGKRSIYTANVDDTIPLGDAIGHFAVSYRPTALSDPPPIVTPQVWNIYCWWGNTEVDCAQTLQQLGIPPGETLIVGFDSQVAGGADVLTHESDIPLNRKFATGCESSTQPVRLKPSIFSLLLLPNKATLLSFCESLKSGFAWKAIFAAIFALLFGNVRIELFSVLLVAITINYVTGVIAQHGKQDSLYQGYMGIYRQIGIILILIVGNLLEAATKALNMPITLTVGNKEVASITDFVVAYLLFQCLQDIVTNLKESGVQIPGPIEKLLARISFGRKK